MSAANSKIKGVIVKILRHTVRGFYDAAYGARLSFKDTSLPKLDSCETTDTLGKADLKLLSGLVRESNSAAKYMRDIIVTVVYEATTKWCMQNDTYKVGTVKASNSQMHNIKRNPITQACFDTELPDSWIEHMEHLRITALRSGSREDFKRLVDSIPQGWLYHQQLKLNYQNLRAIYFDRRHHRYDDWAVFCEWIESLPYATELITVERGR